MAPPSPAAPAAELSRSRQAPAVAAKEKDRREAGLFDRPGRDAMTYLPKCLRTAAADTPTAFTAAFNSCSVQLNALHQ